MNFSFPIILASNSPRRQELFKNLGIPFQVQVKETEELYPADMPATEVAKYLAEKKAEAFLPFLKDELVITADTTVVVDDNILNKPANADEAFAMLRQLSGRAHQVITGVCLQRREQKYSFDDTTQVFFRTLTEEEIWHYVRTYQPFDKAGGYGIQEWIGMIGIEKIAGSYYNVVGLPLEKLYKQLQKFST